MNEQRARLDGDVWRCACSRHAGCTGRLARIVTLGVGGSRVTAYPHGYVHRHPWALMSARSRSSGRKPRLRRPLRAGPAGVTRSLLIPLVETLTRCPVCDCVAEVPARV